MHARTLVSLATLFSLAAGGSLAAQGSSVSPDVFQVAEAPSWNTPPFGVTQIPYKYLQVHDDLPQAARTINGISFRRDGPLPTTSYGTMRIMADFFLSTAAPGISAGSPDATFDSNHGANRTQVASFRIYDLPATEFTNLPSDWEYHFPFSTPFSWPGQGSLVWEVLIHSRQGQSGVRFDWASGSSSNPAPARTVIQTGCTASGQSNPMAISAGGSSNWSAGGVTFSWTGSRGPANSTAFMMLGLNRNSFGGIPLPFEIPGTAAGSSGPCFVYNDAILFLPALTSATGAFTSNLGLTVDSFMVGGTAYGQAVAPDAAANPVGLITSNQSIHNIVGPYPSLPVGTVFLAGGGASGSAQANRGLVVRFNH